MLVFTLLAAILTQRGACELITLQPEACREADFTSTQISCSYISGGLYGTTAEIHVETIYFDQFSEGRLALINLTNLMNFVVKDSIFDERTPCELLVWRNDTSRMPSIVIVTMGDRTPENCMVCFFIILK